MVDEQIETASINHFPKTWLKRRAREERAVAREEFWGFVVG